MSYRVVIPPVAEPITLERAKAHLRVVFDDDDAQILGMISAARDMLEKRLNRALMPQTIEATVDYFADGIPLPLPPYLGGLQVAYTDASGVSQTLAPTAYTVDQHSVPARLYAAWGTTWPTVRIGPGAVVLTYQAGYASAAQVPATLVQWMLLAIGTMYENRETMSAGVSVTSIPEEFMHWLWHPYMVYA